MRTYLYTSAFAEEIEAFVAFKESVGVSSQSRNWTLYDFDRYCAAAGLTEFDRETVEGWVKRRKARLSSEHLSWMSCVRELGRFMRAHGRPEAYVLSDEFKAKMVRVAPYLLTGDEMEAFFGAVGSYAPRSPWAWQSVCFFGLMHSCGLRTCEARRLRREDAGLADGSIAVMWSKGNRSRRLAITGEVAEMLERCDAVSTVEFGADRPAFFVSAHGNQVTPASVGVNFRRIWEAAGLPGSKGGKCPRPYDLRHRFAYANIERWQSEGADVAAMLPYLAKYMGHATFDSTYHYVHTSPDFLDGYADSAVASEGLLPEVGFDA